MNNKTPFLNIYDVILASGKRFQIRAERANYDADDDAFIENFIFFTKNELVCVLPSSAVLSIIRTDAHIDENTQELLTEAYVMGLKNEKKSSSSDSDDEDVE